MFKRRLSREVYAGPVGIGGNHPVSVQSMTNTDTRDRRATLEQLNKLAEAGCEIIRLAVPGGGRKSPLFSGQLSQAFGCRYSL